MALTGLEEAREYIFKEVEVKKPALISSSELAKLRAHLQDLSSVDRYSAGFGYSDHSVLKHGAELLGINFDGKALEENILQNFPSLAKFTDHIPYINPHINPPKLIFEKEQYLKKIDPYLGKMNLENLIIPKLGEKIGNIEPKEPEDVPEERGHIFRLPVDFKEISEDREVFDPPTVYPFGFVDSFRKLEKLRERFSNDEEMVRGIEKMLGIEGDLQRCVEAALLIDWKFLCTGVIASNNELEKMFGEDEWTDWVTARLVARAYGKCDLTFDFVTFLHSCLTRKSDAGIGKKLRSTTAKAGDYSEPKNPSTYTMEQLRAVGDNPMLDFIQEGDDPNVGFIGFVDIKNKEMVEGSSERIRSYFNEAPNTRRLVGSLLMDLCDWYNQERQKDHDPHQLAASLQRKFVSIHPFVDVNGRLSRLLMNWSLENDGVNPSIVFEPGNDILTADADWVEEVRSGSLLHQTLENKRKKLESVGYEDVAEMLGLSSLKTFYDLIFSQLEKAPDKPKNGEIMSHLAYEEFIKSLQKEYDRFKDYYTKTREIHNQDGFINYTQGDFIPESYINLITLNPKDGVLYRDYLKKYFYTQLGVYRGGSSKYAIGERDVVRMFEQYVGLDAGYLALQEAQVNPMSTATVSKEIVAKSLNEHNLLLARSYLSQFHGDKIINYDGLTFSEVMRNHTLGGSDLVFSSPFASTSISRSIAEDWAIRGDTVAKSGVFIKSFAPRFGGILTFGKGKSSVSDMLSLKELGLAHPMEEELLVPGGVDPASIKELMVYKADKGVKSLAFIAKKVEEGGNLYLDVVDIFNNKKRRYKLNPKSNEFELIIEPKI